jgi:LmbE family N-acetylglucosaminyl deacetylase
MKSQLRARLLSSVLLIFAHPDDETMVGGVLGRLQEAKVSVCALYLTRGEGSPENLVDPSHSDPKKDVGILRPKELRKAARYHGFKKLVILKEADRGYTTDADEFLQEQNWDLERIEEQILAMVHEAKPSVIITMLPEHDATHAHHQIAGRMVMRLFEEGKLGASVQAIYAGLEHDWKDKGTFRKEMKDGLRFSRKAFSKKFQMTWSEYQAKGAAFHQTQTTGHRVFMTDEILYPLYEKPGKVSLIRRLLRSDRR